MSPVLKTLEKNIVHPREEMLAYETLWALENSKEQPLKEKYLKDLFQHYSPLEALKQVFENQPKSFLKQAILSEQIQQEVESFIES